MAYCSDQDWNWNTRKNVFNFYKSERDYDAPWPDFLKSQICSVQSGYAAAAWFVF